MAQFDAILNELSGGSLNRRGQKNVLWKVDPKVRYRRMAWCRHGLVETEEKR